MDANLKTLIDAYGRACRRDGNPAWESEEGIALLAYLSGGVAAPVPAAHVCAGEFLLSTTTLQCVEPAAQGVSRPASGAASASELHVLRRERAGWQEEAQSLQRRLAMREADNDLLRKKIANDVWTFQGDDEDCLESMGGDMVVVIHAADLRTLRERDRAAAAAEVPPEVIAWRDAYQALLDAIAAYNSHLSHATKHLPCGADVSMHEEALNVAQRRALAAVKPMHDALSAAVSATPVASVDPSTSEPDAFAAREPVAP